MVGAPSLNQNITALLAFAGLTWNDVQKVEFGGFGQAMDGIDQQPGRCGVSRRPSGNAYQDRVVPARHPLSDLRRIATRRAGRGSKGRAVLRPGHGTEGAEMSKDNKAEAATYPYPVLMTMKSTDTDLVYNMTKAMVEFFHDYKDGAPGNNWAGTSSASFCLGDPVH